MADVTLRAAEMPRDLAVVQQLCWAYRDYLVDFDENLSVFYPKETYGALMDALPEMHAQPRGVILLVEQDGVPVGCGMIHPLNAKDAEIKRVYVSDAARGMGAGFLLSEGLIAHARQAGYARILLDTNAQFAHARRLYEKLGFKARGPYADLPEGTEDALVFYEFTL